MADIVYTITDPCSYCGNTWGTSSGRKDVCPMCEKNYRWDEVDRPNSDVLRVELIEAEEG